MTVYYQLTKNLSIGSNKFSICPYTLYRSSWSIINQFLMLFSNAFMIFFIFTRYIVKRKQDSIWNLIEGAHDAWSGWLCVLLVGLFTGAVAGVIDIGASWMTDLKFGICPQAFWLNQEQCCWSSNETSFEGGNCSQVS